jgi:hypothetical protein
MRDLAANAKFLELLSRIKDSGMYVNDSPNHPMRYAPAVFVDIAENNFYACMCIY